MHGQFQVQPCRVSRHRTCAIRPSLYGPSSCGTLAPLVSNASARSSWYVAFAYNAMKSCQRFRRSRIPATVPSLWWRWRRAHRLTTAV